MTSGSSSPSEDLGSSKGSFEELFGTSVEEEEELDDVVGGAEGEVDEEEEDKGAAGVTAAELSSLGTSSGAKITPPGGIFSLLYLQPGV